MILGIVLGEVFYPMEGLRGRGTNLNDDTNCTDQFAGEYIITLFVCGRQASLVSPFQLVQL